MTTPRMIWPAAVLLSLALPLLEGRSLSAEETASAEPPPNRHAVPETRPIQLDGRPLVAEWSPGLTLPLGDGRSKLHLTQFRGTLMVGFESTQAWPPRTSLTLYFAPEGVKGGAHAPGSTYIAYEPYAHDRAHVFAFHHGPDGVERIHDRIVVRRVFGERGCALEMAFNLDVLGITKDKRPPMRFAVLWSHPNSPGATYPRGLQFTAKAGTQKPPALASTDAWGTLDGWGDPTAPGAFAKTEWTQWVEADREITNRGRDAHAEVKLLIEEWRDTKKQDSEFQKAVLDEFDWLARRERLTASDLIAVARTLRFLNRYERALGVLDALVNHPDATRAHYARWERAQTLQDAEQFERAAEDWKLLAERSQGHTKGRYEAEVKKALAKHEARQAEQKLRAEDAATGDLPRVALHTNRGIIVLELFPQDVPNAVKHFLGLVESKFYDGTCFHRVLGTYLAQGGDPKSRELGCEFAGAGSSGREIELEINERHKFWRGAVGFANKQHDPRNGSQFFMLTGPRPDLDTYTCFGYVAEGQAVVDRLEWGDKLEKAVILRPLR